MATNKKSFLLYCDLLEVVDELDNETKGLLFHHILKYVNDEDPEPPNELIKILFIPIKQQLKRDLKKYENITERNRINGSKGGRPKKPKEPNGLSGNPKKPKKADTDTDTVTVIDKDTVKGIEERKIDFANKLSTYQNKYNREMLIEFLEYWSEHEENGKKMRFEMAKNKPFNIGRRLGTWNKKSKVYEKNKRNTSQGATREDVARIFANTFGSDSPNSEG